VTVLTAVSGFEDMLDVQIFCAKQTRELQERLNATLKRSTSMIKDLPPDKVEQGAKQLESLLSDIDGRLANLKAQKDAGKAKPLVADGKKNGKSKGGQLSKGTGKAVVESKS
jgi:hypothetical protein